MARGWESKAVEAQQDDARARTGTHMRPPIDPIREQRRATLMLARTKALSELQLACASAHRSMLEETIAAIDRQLVDLH